MADEDLERKVRELGDIDLAALLCLTGREHCIISTDAEYLDDLTVELQLVASRTFGLNSAVVDCTPETTLDELVAAIHLPQPKPTPTSRTPSPLHTRGPESYFSTHHGGGNGGAHSQHHQHGNLRPPFSLSPGSNATPASPSRASILSTASQQQQQQIANVILARNLDTAPKAVQIQCLELMRTRRIFTRTAVQSCPKQFLFVAVLGAESAGQARLTKHLNDHFYISHWQDPEDGFGYLDEEEGGGGREGKGDIDEGMSSEASSASVVRRTARGSKTPSTPIPAPASAPIRTSGRGQDMPITADWAAESSQAVGSSSRGNNNNNYNSGNGNGNNSAGTNPLFTETDISTLATLGLRTDVDIEIQRYLMNIVAFLRLHRAVTPGSVPPAATTHFRHLVRSLAALHGLGFATPELVQLAARKVYAHHLVVVPAERERSMQWGSDLAAVRALLDDVQPEDIIEDVLGLVDAPV